jgi:GntR family transcriptional regulator
MDLEIDTASAEAVYEQIVRQIQQGVQAGSLAPGDALPSIRQIADDLELNPNTVAKAYKILENNHVIVTAGRRGTFVSADAASQVGQSIQREAAYRMAALVRDLDERGLTNADIKAMFAAAMESTNGRRK